MFNFICQLSYTLYGTQLFSETLIHVLLWKYSVDVATVYHQLTLKNRHYPQKYGWASSHKLRAKPDGRGQEDILPPAYSIIC